ALHDMDLLFESIYEERGRYSVPPERLLRGLVLQALYGIRSERLLCEQLGYNMLYRWFVGLSMDDGAWDHSTYTKNRDRLIEHEVVRSLFERVMQQAKDAQLLCDEHFSVDGTMIRRGPRISASWPRTGRHRRVAAAAATRRSISRVRSAVTRRMSARPIRTPSCSPSRTSKNRCRRIAGTC